MTSAMSDQASKAERFLSLHLQRSPLLMPNPWDVGSARLLASLGFEALATTSSGSAAALGRLDGALSRDDALMHAASLVRAVDVPVSADLENCFADAPEGVATTVELLFLPSRPSSFVLGPTKRLRAELPAGFRENFFRNLERVICGGNAAVDRRLQQDFLNFLPGHAGIDCRSARRTISPVLDVPSGRDESTLRKKGRADDLRSMRVGGAGSRRPRASRQSVRHHRCSQSGLS